MKRLGLALILGLTIALPHFLMCARFGANTPPIPLSATGMEEYGYIDRVYSCFRGYWLNGDSFLAGVKKEVWLMFNTTEALTAALLWPWREQPQLLTALSALFFSFLAALGLLWTFSLEDKRPAAAFAAAIWVLLLLGDWIHRPVQPQGNFFIYAFAFGCLLRLWKSPDLKKAALYGAALGLLPYLYVFYFMFLGLLTALLLGWSLAVERRRDRARALLAALAAAAVVMIPYGIHNIGLRGPEFSKILFNYGFVSTHAPALLRSLKLTVAAAILLGLLRDKNSRVFYGLAALAALGVYNQQIVLGLQPPEGEFHMWRVLVLPLGACLHLIFSRLSFYRGLPAAAALYLLLAGQQYRAFSKALERFDSRILAYAPALQWLRHHSPEESVVVSADEMSWVIPVMARREIFHWLEQPILLPLEECWRRNFIFFDLYQLPRQRLAGHIVKNHYEFFGLGTDHSIGKERVGRALARLDFSEVLHILRHPGADQAKIYAAMTGPVEAAYDEFRSRPAAPGVGVDYLLYGPLEKELSPEFSAERAGQVVWRDEAVTIIKPHRMPQSQLRAAKAASRT